MDLKLHHPRAVCCSGCPWAVHKGHSCRVWHPHYRGWCQLAPRGAEQCVSARDSSDSEGSRWGVQDFSVVIWSLQGFSAAWDFGSAFWWKCWQTSTAPHTCPSSHQCSTKNVRQGCEWTSPQDWPLGCRTKPTAFPSLDTAPFCLPFWHLWSAEHDSDVLGPPPNGRCCWWSLLLSSEEPGNAGCRIL